MAAFAALLVLMAGLVLIGGGGSQTKRRVQNISSRGGGGNTSGFFKFLKSDDSGSRRKQIEESLGQIESNQKDRRKRLKSLKSKLIQADWSTPPQVFNIVCASIGLAAGFGVFFLTNNMMFAGGAAFVLGFGVPRWFLNMVIKRRQKKFVSHFADAMDIIVRGIKTGLPLGDCLKIIAHESPEPVRAEFLRVVEGESLGVPLDTCLTQMYDRMPVSEVNFFATVLNIQRSTGGNLGEALGNLSNVLRSRKLLAEKIKALSAEAKMSAIIIGALPLVVMALVSVMSPDYMTELYTTKTGHRNLMIGAGMMILGTLMMRKMINFKY
jgi:tight adherence protein B